MSLNIVKTEGWKPVLRPFTCSFIWLLLAFLLAFRGSGLELVLMEKFMPDMNPQSHWAKCIAGHCHCKLAGICNEHCCCAFRKAHPEIVQQDIERNRFFIRHSCQGSHHRPFVWPALSPFVFPHVPQALKLVLRPYRWFRSLFQHLPSHVLEPPDKIPRLPSFSFIY